ncbi:MAG: hypothetical protein Greene041619_1043 [Candidatus Peregrinibacteria bacterium Greene0416_19]|nr:MAG: hypothetical protein Greene041619_1043 [Candidatus Peregrinibacteria bacterium Greene0416_19]
MTLLMPDILMFLYIIVAVMIIVVLYHALFIMVDLRKVLRRVEDITAQVEAVILKPISMADQILTWIMEHVESKKHRRNVKAERKD